MSLLLSPESGSGTTWKIAEQRPEHVLGKRTAKAEKPYLNQVQISLEKQQKIKPHSERSTGLTPTLVQQQVCLPLILHLPDALSTQYSLSWYLSNEVCKLFSFALLWVACVTWASSMKVSQ